MVRRAFSCDEDGIALNAQTTGAGKQEGNVDDLVKLRLRLRLCKGVYGGMHLVPLLVRHRQQFFIIQSEAALPPLLLRALVEEINTGAQPHLLQQLADHSGTGFTLDPARFAQRQRSRIAVDETLGQGRRTLWRQTERRRCHQNTDNEPRQLPCRRRHRRFIEIVNIKVSQSIVAFVAAEVLQMQIAATPDRWRRSKDTALGQAVVEQMAGPAQKDEGGRTQRSILHGESLRIASHIRLAYAIDDFHTLPFFEPALSLHYGLGKAPGLPRFRHTRNDRRFLNE